jgi:hypothetical protein
MERNEASKSNEANASTAPDMEQNQETKTEQTQMSKPDLSPEQQDWLNRVFIPNFRQQLLRTMKTKPGLSEAEQAELDSYRQRKDELEERELRSKGEFEELLQRQRNAFHEKFSSLAKDKDELMQKLRRLKVERSLTDAAQKHHAVNAGQVMKLLSGSVAMDEAGEAVVVDGGGHRRIGATGEFVSVENFVTEFLQENPHMVSPSAAISGSGCTGELRPGRITIEPVTGGDLIAEGLREERFGPNNVNRI